MSRNAVLGFLVLLLPATSSVAQSRFELTPFFGMRAGGSFRAIEQGLALDVKRSGGYGLTFGVDLNQNMQVEFLWSHQSSSLEAISLIPLPPEGGPAPTLGLPPFDIRVDYYHGAFVYGGGPEVFQPYVAIGAGVGAFDADMPGAASRNRFSFSLGTGFKSFFTERIGVRFDARAFGTRFGGDREDFACTAFGCVSFETAATFWQGQLVGGLIVAF